MLSEHIWLFCILGVIAAPFVFVAVCVIIAVNGVATIQEGHDKHRGN